VQDQTSEEFAAGVEAMATLKTSNENTLKVGAKVVRTLVGPNRDARLDPTTNTPIDEGSDEDTLGNPFTFAVPYYGTVPGTDDTAAVYFEDFYRFGPASIFAGGRLDSNDFRERGFVFLPRAG